MNQDEFDALALRAMSDPRDIPLTISFRDAWLLLSALQLAVKHPQFPLTTKAAVTSFGRQIQNYITSYYPEAAPALELGWKPLRPEPKKFNRNNRNRRRIQ